MIIRECYVDNFAEADDLCLEDLASGLNLIRVSDSAEVSELGHFFAAMLVGDTSASVVPLGSVSGSLVAQVDSSHLELVRLADRRGLHFLDAQGRAVQDCSLPERMNDIGTDAYLSLFTDRVMLSDRLPIWHQRGIVQELVGPAAPMPPKKSVDESVVAIFSNKIGESHGNIQRLTQQRDQLLNQIKSDDGHRASYLAARQQQADAVERAEQLRESIQQGRQRSALLDATISLAVPWARRAEVQAELDRFGSIRVHPKDIKRVRELDRQLEQLRMRLRKARTQLEHASNVVESPPNEVSELLRDASAALRRDERIAEIQTRLADHAIQPGSTDDRDAIHRLELAAARLREARSSCEASARTEETPRLFAAPELPVVDALSEPDLEEMRSRIDTLKAETRKLLQSRLLSPIAILVIGILFSSGVALILASLVFDFGTANMSIGAIGITAAAAAALLKISFERPAAEEMRRHRTRVDQLLSEVEQPGAGEDEDLVVCEEIVESETFEPALSHSFAELERAEHDWRDLMQSLNLPVETALPKALELVHARSLANERSDNPLVEELRSDLAKHQGWLSQWRRSAALCLKRDLDTVEQTETASVIRWLHNLQSTAHETASESEQAVRNEISECQQELKQHKRARGKILARAGVEDLDQLREKVQQRRQLTSLQEELQSLQERIESALGENGQSRQLQRLLETHDRDALQRQFDEQQEVLRRLQSDKVDTDTLVERTQQSMKQLTSNRTGAEFRQQLATLERRIAVETKQLGVLEVSRRVTCELTSREVARTRSAGLDLATRLLQAAGNHNVRIDYDGDSNEFMFVDADGTRRLRELGETDARLTLISLQLAASILYARQDLQLPVVLEDHSLGDDPETFPHLARITREATTEALQLFVLTSRDSVSQAFAAIDIPSVKISRTVVESPELPAPDVEPSDEIEAAAPVDPIMAAPFPPVVEAGRSSYGQPSRTETAAEMIDWISVEYQVAPQDRAESSAQANVDRLSHPSPTPSDIEISSTTEDRRIDARQPRREPASIVEWESIEEPTRDEPIADRGIDTVHSIHLGDQRADRSNTPPSRWHRLDSSHAAYPAKPTEPRQQRSSARLRHDELPEWWPD